MTAAEKKEGAGEKLIAGNPAARQKYFIEEVLEAGMVLTGTEIKSLRSHAPNMKDAFVDIRSRGSTLEAWLLNTHIAPYSHGNIFNHEPMRRRKLLLHKSELTKLFGAITKKGLTIVPLRMYFKKGYAKIEIALAKGKKQGDKRAAVKEKQADREIQRALRKGR